MKKNSLLLAGIFLGLLFMGTFLFLFYPSRRSPDIVLISVDTLRADHLGCFGNKRVLTPNIDSLAREGILFRKHFTVIPSTLASHTSLFSGLYPREAGVPRNSFPLPENLQTLPRILKEKGYQTFGVVGAYSLSSDFNFHLGFDHFDEQFTTTLPGKMQNFRKAFEVNQAVFPILEKHLDPEKSLFLFVHYFDPHWPYSPPQFYRSLYDEKYSGKFQGTLEDIFEVRSRLYLKSLSLPKKEVESLFKRLENHTLSGEDIGRALSTFSPPSPDRDTQHLAHLYEAEITYTDAHIGSLLKKLESLGRLENSILVLTSDHGETLWEHPEFFTHGFETYDTTLHIPLILCASRLLPKGQEVKELTRSIDLLPTLLDLIGENPPPGLSGESLLKELQGLEREGKPRVLFAEASQPIWPWVEEGKDWPNRKKACCVRTCQWKYTFTSYMADRRELFFLEEDLKEENNLLKNVPGEKNGVQKKAEELHRMLMEWDRNTSFTEPKEENGRREERLKSLGYYR